MGLDNGVITATRRSVDQRRTWGRASLELQTPQRGIGHPITSRTQPAKRRILDFRREIKCQAARRRCEHSRFGPDLFWRSGASGGAAALGALDGYAGASAGGSSVRVSGVLRLPASPSPLSVYPRITPARDPEPRPKNARSRVYLDSTSTCPDLIPSASPPPRTEYTSYALRAPHPMDP